MDSPEVRLPETGLPKTKIPSLGEALRLWLKIGCIGFGGPSGQIAILQSEVVEKRGWIGEEEFLRALQFCMLLPGPEAQQLATYLGWRLHGIRGGIAAGVLFILPSALLLWMLSLLYVLGQDVPFLSAFFEGLKPAVVAIVAAALWRIGRRTITSLPLALIACGAFLLFCFHASYPAVILGIGLLGSLFLAKAEEDLPTEQTSGHGPNRGALGWAATLRVALTLAALWIIPIAALWCWLGSKALPVRVALFFGKVAVFSFGGAYAALSYVALHAAGDWGWLTSGQMLDGVGLAETTPGPLLIALQFVAFVACFKNPGILPPLLAATLGSLAALWSLFLPSFLWIFAFAPRMERLGRNRHVAGALSAIGAVVTAVIAFLALWFAGNVFLPHGTIAAGSLVIAVAALLLMQLQKVGMIPLILGCGLTGVLFRMIQ
jgi:chromate transporter